MGDAETAAIDRLHEQQMALNQQFAEHAKDDERRFGRIEKMLLALAALILLPKMGGSDPSTLLAHIPAVIQSFL
jgi:cell division protein FtsL